MKISINPAIAIPAGVVALFVGLWLFFNIWTKVPAGHVKVPVLFGEIQNDTLDEGLHLPINPLMDFVLFDVRQKTAKIEDLGVPSRDQLISDMDISIQYRIDKTVVNNTLRETGKAEAVITTHLVPNIRSLAREAGKKIDRAEDFFKQETQDQMQQFLLSGIRQRVEAKGLLVDDILIRRTDLPVFIQQAIESKKEREQEAEKQKAELARFKTEQEQKLAQAEAERLAAEEQAKQIEILAKARAFEIEEINKAIASNPAYIQLEAIKALKEMSKDPAAKIYMLDGTSTSPIPLMNIGK